MCKGELRSCFVCTEIWKERLGGELDQDGGLWEPQGGDPDPFPIPGLVVPSVSSMPLV